MVGTLLAAGCAPLFPTDRTAIASCFDWSTMSDQQQIDLATTIVDANRLLERVRVVQHEGPATTNDTLIREVVASVTKNCDVMHQPSLDIEDLTRRLYG
jgi:hypothetical protein